MMNSQVLCFGELLIRYQSDSNPFFKEKKATFNAYAGGSEANVAVALVKQDVPVCYLTAIPENPLSRSLVTILSGYGIDTSRIICKGVRIGSYFLFSPNGLTTGDVLYDRKYSSFHQLNRDDILWDEVFDGVDWFHFSALTPAMSAEHAALCLQGLKAAQAKGITISVDLNYRSKLWQYGKHPNQVMPALVEYADVIMGNIWASHTMLDTRLPDGLNRHSSKELLVSVSEDCAGEIFRRYKNCQHVS
ncbi:MAG: PfkB family carbohydrate kinase, partial [Sphingobacterium sp.]